MSSTLLMCKPDYFNVDYVINPWMNGHIHLVDKRLAEEQWQAFYETLRQYATIQLISPKPHLPDLVFTANGGLVYDKLCILAHFRHKQRQGEEVFFKQWFEKHGYTVLQMPKSIYFEGTGDALFQRDGKWVWMGYNIRSELKACEYLETYLSMPVTPLKLINEKFYHLDTCFCPLFDGAVMYYPGAFDADSVQLIEKNIDEDKRLVVSDEDALHFSCNALVIKTDKIPTKKAVIFMTYASDPLQTQLNQLGYEVIIRSVSEFRKAGGANKCLVLEV
ncbi:dimethylarginine dimethylaminohydrolase family protein [Coxiella burnetii]|uniref:Amidinotransferase family protein n=2 Tax=Coxiella burnetii TaxID=777 RepID=Q83EN6_COXBU|nr:arginine deiminase-related protein [Coxiella burnetii]NP_819323.1 amidinotransferase family protein [Coxiella burnetii RSA 493]AAO89837.1 amidinotransferase family protein [Coxiella burnetii RSA 493]ABS77691.1 amidinotransferase family protein [Coxiella burnetii Dugway 5J108-111]ACJ19003.1 amidinotransferase family protein [Coxiella burnetii CbuG_Q212]ACJ19756.1 amidinotransferase family protein [Coxiella burnetii CbuK_Q154]ARI65177.1 amidinotransferase [Coxiella burnetii]